MIISCYAMSNREAIIKKLNLIKDFSKKYDEMTDELKRLNKEVDRAQDRPKLEAFKRKKRDDAKKKFDEDLIELFDKIEEQYLMFMDEWYIGAYFAVHKKKLLRLLDAQLNKLLVGGFRIELDGDCIVVELSPNCYPGGLTVSGKVFKFDSNITIHCDKDSLVVGSSENKISYAELDSSWKEFFNSYNEYHKSVPNSCDLLDSLYGKYKDSIDEIMEVNDSLLIEELGSCSQL